MFFGSDYFLFKRIENIAVEEFAQTDIQSVAEFFDRNDRNIAAAFVHHAVGGGGGYTRPGGKLVEFYIPFSANLQKSFGNRIFDAQLSHLKNIVLPFVHMRIRICVIE